MFAQPGEEKAEEGMAAVLKTLLCSTIINGNLGNQLLKFHLDIKELFLIVRTTNDWKRCQ